MTSLFVLIFMGMTSTAEANVRHHAHRPPATHVAPRHHAQHVKPRDVKVYMHQGHRHYRHAGLVWRWARGHWAHGHWIRGHWEISYRF